MQDEVNTSTDLFCLRGSIFPEVEGLLGMGSFLKGEGMKGSLWEEKGLIER